MAELQPQANQGRGPAAPAGSASPSRAARQRDGRPLYLFYHVPKCAGTTLIGHLAEHMPERLLMPTVRRGFLKELGGGVANLGRLPDDLEGIDVVAGHTASASVTKAFPSRTVRSLTMLRDPVGFLVSIYNERERHSAVMGWNPVSFDYFRRTMPKNPIIRLLLLRYLGIGYPLILGLDSRKRLEIVERALSRCWFVGSWQHADQLAAELSRRLGIPTAAPRQNVSPSGSLSVSDLPHGLAAQIRAQNALDQLLFDRWKDALWSGREAAVERPVPARDQLSYVADDATRHVWWRIVLTERRLPRRAPAAVWAL